MLSFCETLSDNNNRILLKTARCARTVTRIEPVTRSELDFSALTTTRIATRIKLLRATRPLDIDDLPVPLPDALELVQFQQCRTVEIELLGQQLIRYLCEPVSVMEQVELKAVAIQVDLHEDRRNEVLQDPLGCAEHVAVPNELVGVVATNILS